MTDLVVSIPIPPGLLKKQLLKIQSEIVAVCPPMAKAAVKKLSVELLWTMQRGCEEKLKSIVSQAAAAQTARPNLQSCGIGRTNEFQLSCLVTDNHELNDLWNKMHVAVVREEIDIDKRNPCKICSSSLSDSCSSLFYYLPGFSISLFDVRALGETWQGPTALKDFMRRIEIAFSNDPLAASQRYEIDQYQSLRKRINYTPDGVIGSFSVGFVQISSPLPYSSRGKVLATYELGLDLEYFALSLFPQLAICPEEEEEEENDDDDDDGAFDVASDMDC